MLKPIFFLIFLIFISNTSEHEEEFYVTDEDIEMELSFSS